MVTALKLTREEFEEEVDRLSRRSGAQQAVDSVLKGIDIAELDQDFVAFYFRTAAIFLANGRLSNMRRGASSNNRGKGSKPASKKSPKRTLDYCRNLLGSFGFWVAGRSEQVPLLQMTLEDLNEVAAGGYKRIAGAQIDVTLAESLAALLREAEVESIADLPDPLLRKAAAAATMYQESRQGRGIE